MEETLISLTITVAGSFINFIATKIYSFFTGKPKNFIWQNKDPFAHLNVINDLAEIKRRTRIIVIDDEDSFPISLFQAEGYSIEKWTKVEDYAKLENGFYDIIVLDIKGVANHISVDDGLGVLENLKKKNPAQIIIAYSQHSFDLSKARFWEMADEKIAKPSDFLRIKAILENLIITQFKPKRYIDALKQTLKANNYQKNDILKLENAISQLIKSKGNPNWSRLLNFCHNDPQLYAQLASIINTIIKLYK